jgi:hypothetical protein
VEARRRCVQQAWFAARRESIAEEEVGPRRLEELSGLPFRGAALDPDPLQSSSREDAQLVASELARFAGAPGPKAKQNAEARGAHLARAHSQAGTSVRRTEEKRREAARGHPGREKEDGRLVLPGHIRAQVQLREGRNRKSACAPVRDPERDHGDRVAPADGCRLGSGRGHPLDRLAVGFPGGHEQVLDVEADAHGEEP